MSKFPKTFEIGGVTYTVSWVSNKRMTKITGNDSWGASQPAAGKIWLNKRLRKYNADLADQTFLHEVMHCVLWVVNAELWKDERLVDGIAHALLQIKKSSKH